ncbi:hypothetical protein [Corynebacterium striatum]|uniref:hypothetical protein n=1 Tax=Corynebacterium striatum TaxID=43770 RepID=UPI003F7DF995
MARNPKQTSRSTAKASSKVLRGKSYSAAAKKAAGSALPQASKLLSAGSWYRGYGSVVLPVSG